MKTLKVITLILVCCLTSLNAQDTINSIHLKFYKTWVYSTSRPYITDGVLYQAKDSSILVARAVKVQDYSIIASDIAKFNINNIESIRVRRNDRILNGFLIGALSGFAVGAIFGGIVYKRHSEKYWILFKGRTYYTCIGGLIGASVGIAIGASLGSARIIIPINGKQDNYTKQRKKLKEYSVKKR